jgi:hypothetical protein
LNFSNLLTAIEALPKFLLTSEKLKVGESILKNLGPIKPINNNNIKVVIKKISWIFLSLLLVSIL